MNTSRSHLRARTSVLLTAIVAFALSAHADVVTDANTKAAEVVSHIPATPFAVRTMAIAQVSVFEAVNAITGRYPPFLTKVDAAPGASVDAAVAAATRTAFLTLVPDQKQTIEANYEATLKSVPDGASKTDGIAVGEKAAEAVLAARKDDGAATPETYRPRTSAGVYIPTTIPAVPVWGQRKPWFMTKGDEFRPGPPPSLASDIWVRDFNEIKAVGGKTSAQRTPEQTECARFWEATSPTVYWPVVRCVANMPGRDVTDNAHLLAVAATAMDDALIAVFDAKYAYNFWRPITAIRNADLDSSDATERDPGWKPFIETPMHPEYPCAHCIVSGALAAVLKAEIGTGTTPKLSSTSPTADGAVRSWKTVDEFTHDVAEGRICDGVHFRNSTEVGTAMGKKVGELAVESFPHSESATRK